MARRSEFVTYLLEQLTPLGEVSARGMFGGYGIYFDGRMFALVAQDTFYVKSDDVSRPEFEREGLEPFRFESSKGTTETSYYQPPSAAIDDREKLCEWARKGIEAAKRSALSKAAKKPRKPAKRK
jgi:DNA transformation protein